MAFKARVDYTIDSTIYTVPFPALEASHLVLYIDDVEVASSEYTVGPDLTRVVFPAIPEGDVLSIRRATPSGYIASPTQDAAYRYSVEMNQRNVAEAFRSEERLDQLGQAEFGDPSDRTEGILGYDENGDVLIATTTVGELDTLQSDVTQLCLDVTSVENDYGLLKSDADDNTDDISALETQEATHIDDAPADGEQYVRRDAGWESYTGTETGTGITDAPDSSLYGRKDGAWDKLYELLSPAMEFTAVPTGWTLNSSVNVTAEPSGPNDYMFIAGGVGAPINNWNVVGPYEVEITNLPRRGHVESATAARILSGTVFFEVTTASANLRVGHLHYGFAASSYIGQDARGFGYAPDLDTIYCNASPFLVGTPGHTVGGTRTFGVWFDVDNGLAYINQGGGTRSAAINLSGVLLAPGLDGWVPSLSQTGFSNSAGVINLGHSPFVTADLQGATAVAFV